MNPPLDIGSLTAIDVHVDAEVSASGRRSLPGDLEKASGWMPTSGRTRWRSWSPRCSTRRR